MRASGIIIGILYRTVPYRTVRYGIAHLVEKEHRLALPLVLFKSTDFLHVQLSLGHTCMMIDEAPYRYQVATWANNDPVHACPEALP